MKKSHPSISQEIFTRIQTELSQIEKEKDVCILYACESGSRAWGFESSDSDYDVRFIYIHSPRWYLTILNQRDVIEKPISDELDISGWDLRKALQLLKKSNPPFLEWMQSPIVYREESNFLSSLKELSAEYYSPNACLYHYLHMAENNYRHYFKGDEVKLKKYLYVLRPILACKWIEEERGVVPIEFGKLFESLIQDPKLIAEVEKLLQRKKSGKEVDRAPKIPILDEFIEEELTRLSSLNTRPAMSKSVEKLDEFFQKTLMKIWKVTL